MSMWMSSIRQVGGWKGEILIVTDHAKCLAKTLTEAKLLGPMITSDDNVDIFGPAEGSTGNLHLVKRPVAKNVFKMKLEKARAWLNVKVAAIPHPVSSIIYTDEDVVIGKNLRNFVSVIRELEKAKHTLALFRDTGTAAGELHTGVVAMFPGPATDRCLQAWGKKLTGTKIGTAIEPQGAALNVHEGEESIEIKEDALLAEESLVMGPDQQALGLTRECKKQADHDGVRILPKEFFWLPTPVGLKSGRQAEFVHFTNTGRWKLINHKTIKMYLAKIGIPDTIDPMGSLKDKECAIPEGGTIKDVNKGPTNYKKR